MRLALAALLAAAGLGRAFAEEPAPKPKARIDEAIRIQKNTRAQLESLIKIMQTVVDQVQKTDPAAARALASAADRAQSALLTERMDEVVKQLLDGWVVPADQTQALVLRSLREILEALRSGGDASLDARIIYLQKLQAMIAVLGEVIRQQKDLERQSRYICQGPTVLPRFQEARQKAQSLVERQHAVMRKMDKLEVDAVQQKLYRARQALLSQLSRLEDMLRRLAQPFPSPDDMTASAGLQKTFHRGALSAFSDLKLLLNDPSLSSVADELKAAIAGQGKVVDEAAKTAEALAQDDLKAARLAGAEARFRLKEALGALAEAGRKRSAAAGASTLVSEQEGVTAEFNTLSALVDELAPPQAGGAGALARPPTGALARPPTGEGARGSPPAAPAEAPAPPPEPLADATREAAADAAGHLAAGNREAALMEQAQTVSALEVLIERLAKKAEQLEELRKNPDYPRQEAEQRSISEKLAKAGAGALVSPTPETAGQPSPNEMLKEAHLRVRQAGEHSDLAAAALNQTNAAKANPEQNEVIAILEKTLENLASECARTAREVLDELSQQWIAVLERAIQLQKSVSADTLEVYKKRLPDGTYRRTEQLIFTTLAQSEDLVLKTLDEMEDLMSKAVSAHAKVTFPPICNMLLAMVRQDLGTIKNRLAAKDAGEQTQRMQKDIEERLAGLMKALGLGDQKDLGSRPPLWGDNGVGNPDASQKGREAELELIIAVQIEINRRIAECEGLKKAGQPLPADFNAKYHELLQLQGEIRRSIRGYLIKDLQMLPGEVSGRTGV